MKLTLMKKLSLSFGIVLVIWVISGIVNFSQLRKIERNISKITEIEEPTDDAAMEMEINLLGTGFGLLGHACQVAQNSQVGINIALASVPIFPEAKEFAKRGFCPAGLQRNREFYSTAIEISNDVPGHLQNILFDPQTSGGLLISLTAEAAELLVNRLREARVQEAAIIGEVVRKPAGGVLVR